MNFASKYVFASDNEEVVDEAVLDAADEVGISAAVAVQGEAKADNGKPSDKASDKDKKEAAKEKAPAKGILASISGLFGSSSSAPVNKPAPASAVLRHKKKMHLAAPRRQKVDTNVVAISFSTLSQNADELFAGDAVFCRNKDCKAVFSHVSKLEDPKASAEASKDVKDSENKDKKDDKDSKDAKKDEEPQPQAGQKLWQCEYCSTKNYVDLDPEEVPHTESRDYVLEAAKEKKDEKKGDADSDAIVVFVIDVSGSMAVTTEVQGSFKLKGVKEDQTFSQYRDQPPQAKKNVTYVSRLQSVQAAVDKQLDLLEKQFPKRKACLITFNNEVTIHGDGTTPTEVVAGDKLKNQEVLQQIGKKYEVKQTIAASRKALGDKLFSLEEGGQTALGPAMIVALSLASNKAGSSVIICTDGLANIGLGALDSIKTDEERAQVTAWYEGIGNWAKLVGVTASVVSISGDECSLADLGRVAAATGGDVDRVNPNELTKNFASILANPVIATQVGTTFILHQALQFRNENTNESRLTRDIGNVTKDTEALLEFGIRSKEALAKHPGLKQLPFQVQITFTAVNGMRAMRVITRAQPITVKKEEAEKDVRVDVLSANVAQQSARMAQKGDYLAARVNNVAYSNLMGRVVHNSGNQQQAQQQYQQFMQDVDLFDRAVVNQSVQEAVDEEDLEAEVAAEGKSDGKVPQAPGAPSAGGAGSAAKPRLAKPSVRGKQKVADDNYKVFHKFQAKSSNAYH